MAAISWTVYEQVSFEPLITPGTRSQSQVDPAFYPPWDGKMSTSQRAVMLCGQEGITAGLVESNGSLPLGGWLQVTCGLTACTPGSARGPTLGNEYGKPLPCTQSDSSKKRTWRFLHLWVKMKGCGSVGNFQQLKSIVCNILPFLASKLYQFRRRSWRCVRNTVDIWTLCTLSTLEIQAITTLCSRMACTHPPPLLIPSLHRYVTAPLCSATWPT